MTDPFAFIQTIPFWVLGTLIFLLRVVDVSLGTLRTILMVQGRVRLAVPLGFFEVLVWVLAVAQVVGRLDESPWLALFFAAGHATGVAVGMLIERRLALGKFVLRIISRDQAHDIVQSVSSIGRVLATFKGETQDGPVTLIFLSVPGRRVRHVIDAAKAADPDVVYLVESARAWSENMYPLPHGTGWRSPLKKK